MDFERLIVAALVGAALNLDRQVFGHFMLSRPLAVGLFMGLILDNHWAGIWLGLASELLWLSYLPLGGEIPPNGGLALAAVITGWALGPMPITCDGTGSCGLVTAFLLMPIWARPAALVERFARGRALARLNAVEAVLERGEAPRFFLHNGAGVLFTFGASLIFMLVAATVNYFFFIGLGRWLPAWGYTSLKPFMTLVPLLGFIVMAVAVDKKTTLYYLAGLGASLLTLSGI